MQDLNSEVVVVVVVAVVVAVGMATRIESDRGLFLFPAGYFISVSFPSMLIIFYDDNDDDVDYYYYYYYLLGFVHV